MPAVLVLGPAGSGKSTFCEIVSAHCEEKNRMIHVVNLDPAVDDDFKYAISADIRTLISVHDVMADMQLGPNGALVHCMDFLADNIDWLENVLHEIGADEYVLFDCPGQIELYSHHPAMGRIVSALHRLGIPLAATYIIDSHCVSDASKFVSGVLCCLSAMTALELPHISVLSKCDLVPQRHQLNAFLEVEEVAFSQLLSGMTDTRFLKLNTALCELICEWSMVQFLPLDPRDPGTIDMILAQIDHAVQYHDNVEPAEPTVHDEIPET